MISGLLLLLLLISTTIPSPTTALSFNFTTFTSSNQNITYEQAFAAENSIQLTRNLLGSDLNISFGRATYRSPLPLYDPNSRNLTDFRTHFTFSISSQIQGLTRDGQLLNTTANRFVAVEFDIFSNEFDPPTVNPEEEQRQQYAEHLTQWVWDLYGDGTLLIEGPDSRLGKDFDEREMERLMIIGLSCAHPHAKFRPSIRQALQVLNFEAPLPVLPLSRPVATYVSAPSTAVSSTFSSSTVGGGSSSMDSSVEGDRRSYFSADIAPSRLKVSSSSVDSFHVANTF
ncbi:unnamed protein product [Linum tenue]|uniref:Legume lectin domain-containing protein n=1 Tax=Linum tenue TaxID=586396 RepID=A0AAV0LWA8_9ROSI|nr:unnamed protein product [Linum tenue]